MGFPAAIELAIWLNQVRNGSISTSDAVNAAETITESFQISSDQIISIEPVTNWLLLVQFAKSFGVPCFAVLPGPGQTYGLSADLITKIDLTTGVCIIGQKYLLARSPEGDSNWFLTELLTPIPTVDPKSARLDLQDLIERSSAELSAMELLGQRDFIDQELHQLKPIHLPPALSNRVKSDLELAERIWLIAQISMSEAQAPHSRSLDERKIARLRELRTAAINLMTASTLAA